MLLYKCLKKNNNNKTHTHTHTVEILYLQFHSLFQGIPVYNDSDRSSIHIQEHSRQRSCRDRFHKETENKANIGYSIKIPQRSWKTKILIGSWGGPNLAIRMAVKLFKGGGSLVGDWDYFSQDVNEKEVSLFLVLVEKKRFIPYTSG